jgi:hypothetical protein
MTNSKEIKDKRNNTNIEKYGGNCPLHNINVKNKTF